MKFVIEQVALCPSNSEAAIKLLSEIGLSSWARDHVVASGFVHGVPGLNEADLAFNYEATEPGSAKPLELEVLHYTTGPNWMSAAPNTASHLAMHVSEHELLAWRTFFERRNIGIAQSVFTHSHTNPAIAGKRTYNYVIFDTRPILGIDLKFIVRKDV